MTLREELTAIIGKALQASGKGGTEGIAIALGAACGALADRVEALEGHGLKFVGVFQRALASDYAKGSVAVADGSSWIALKDGPEGQPGSSADWHMLCRAGKDGKDAR